MASVVAMGTLYMRATRCARSSTASQTIETVASS
jgi:hypothetical protein